MSEQIRVNDADLGRPIRVLLFTMGPRMDPAVWRFLAMLEGHPEVDLGGIICQSAGQSYWIWVRDYWKRRGLLGMPILGLETAKSLRSRMFDLLRSDVERQVRKQLMDKTEFVMEIHSPAVLERVRMLKPDLGLIYGAPILKPELFRIPTFTTLGIHHGKIPQYRGKKTTFWAVFNGEDSAGVTIQRVSDQLDRGDIVEVGSVPIGIRSLGTVWRELEELGLELYLRAVLGVKRGTARFTKPSPEKGRLYKDPTAMDLIRYLIKRSRIRLLGL